jgi:hypothetical protein
MKGDAGRVQDVSLYAGQIVRLGEMCASHDTDTETRCESKYTHACFDTGIGQKHAMIAQNATKTPMWFSTVIGMCVVAIALLIFSSSNGLRSLRPTENQRYMKRKQKCVKVPEWMPDPACCELLSSTSVAWPELVDAAENCVAQKLYLFSVFFDHAERWPPAQTATTTATTTTTEDSWSCINCIYDARREVWRPHDTRPHIDFTMILFDGDSGGTVALRTQKREFVLRRGDALCLSSGVEHEFKITGEPMLLHFRTKPFASSKYVGYRDRAREIKSRRIFEPASLWKRR